jgi:hypothetical protein
MKKLLGAALSLICLIFPSIVIAYGGGHTPSSVPRHPNHNPVSFGKNGPKVPGDGGSRGSDIPKKTVYSKSTPEANFEITLLDYVDYYVLEFASSLPVRKVSVQDIATKELVVANWPHDEASFSVEVPQTLNHKVNLAFKINAGYFDGKQKILSTEFSFPDESMAELKAPADAPSSAQPAAAGGDAKQP